MPLSKQLFPVVLGPLDQKQDSKSAIHGRVVGAQNCYREKTGEYRKRFGRTALGTVGVPSGTLNSIWQLAAYKNALVALGKSGAGICWGYNETSGKWSAPGSADTNGIRSRQRAQVISKRFPIPMDAGSNFVPDCAAIGDYVVLAWEQSASVIECIYDMAKGTVIAMDNLGTAAHPRVELVSADKICVVYRDGTEIRIREWAASNCSSGTVGATYVTSGLLASTASAFDVVAQDSKLSIGILTTVPDVTVIEYTPVTQAVVQTVPDVSLGAAFRCLGWLKNSAGATNRRYLGTCDANGLVVNVLSVTGTQVAAYILDTDADVVLTCRNITGHSTTTEATGYFNVVYEVAAPDATLSPYDAHVKIGGRNASGTWGGASDLRVRSVGLRSKTFKQGSDYYYLATYNSTVQPAYFLMRAPLDASGADTDAVSHARVPHLKLLKDRANGGTTDPFSGTEDDSALCNVIAHGTNKWIVAVPRQTAATIEGEDQASATVVTRNIQTLIDLVELEFDPSTNAGRPVEAADLLLVPSGQLLAFDGVHYNECGMPLGPEVPTVAVTVGGGSMEAGDRTVIIVYKLTDGKGRVHRSSPSAPSATFTTAANDRITVTCPTLRIFGEERAAAPSVLIEIEVYLTAANGSTYYLAQTVTNIMTADTVAGALYSVADTYLDQGTPIYATGGVTDARLLNTSPPQFKAIAYWNDRVWGIDADFPNRLWYSKPIGAGEGPHFSSSLVLELDDEYGDCTALAPMDDKLVVFKRDAIYALNGDGPDNLGRGLYITPQRVANGVGATHQRGVVAYRDGVAFQSGKGIKAISRGLQVGDLGDPVWDRIGFIGTTATVIDAIHVDNQNQIRFYTDFTDGSIVNDETAYFALVYDYALNEWFEWTYQTNRCAAKVGQEVYQATSTIVVGKESKTLYTDGTGVAIEMQIGTTWFSFAGIGGFKRVYGIQLIGAYRSEHRVEVDVYYDFDETPIVQSLEKIMALDADQEWRLDIPPKKQRCSSIKIVFRDNTATVAAVGTINCVAKANMVDGETLTIGDGTTTIVFEFDVNGTGVTPGRTAVDISTDTTATQVGARLTTAINGSGLVIGATNAAGVLTLLHETLGIIGNVAITDTVANLDFTTTGMHGGQVPGEAFRFSAMAFLIGFKGGLGRLVRGKRLFHAIAGGPGGEA